MNKTERQDVHRLLNRVIDGGSWDSFWFVGYGDSVAIRVKTGDVEYEEKRPRSEIGKLLNRAEEATDE